VTCDDKNPCTDDSCDPQKGCVVLANTATCTDQNACTGQDQCDQGECLPGDATNCDDGNVCTDDSCDPKKGCQNVNNTASCSDGSVCSTADQCKSGSCVAGAQISCNDGNPCTDDSCNPQTGCDFDPNTAPCNDNNGCTTGDACSEGQCLSATGCSSDAQCTPGAQSVSCVCKVGYSGNGFSCSDVNECLSNNGGCSANATCTNTAGSNTCACKTYYTGDGKTCSDVDECASNNGGCSVNATCSNNTGAPPTCTCKPGYLGDGKTCTNLTANEIEYNGYAYRTLDDAPPNAAYGSWTNTCQSGSYVAVPSGYALAPEDSGVVANVIAKYIWSTHCLLFSNGVSYGVKTYNNGGSCGCSGTQCMNQSGSSWIVTSCSRRILIRRAL
jgi:hypothetical protein